MLSFIAPFFFKIQNLNEYYYVDILRLWFQKIFQFQNYYGSHKPHLLVFKLKKKKISETQFLKDQEKLLFKV